MFLISELKRNSSTNKSPNLAEIEKIAKEIYDIGEGKNMEKFRCFHQIFNNFIPE